MASETLARALTGTESVGVIEETLAAPVRIGTSPRIKPRPATPAQAIAFCEQIRSAPMAEPIHAGAAGWPHFTGLVAALGLRGNDITDAWLAAQAIALGARLVTFDRGFRRFPGLQVTILGETTQD